MKCGGDKGMPKPSKVLILSLVLTYAYAFAWWIAEAAIPGLPGIMVGGVPLSLIYILPLGGLVLGCGLAALNSWYFSKKEVEAAKLLEEKKVEEKKG
jgi:hypothetical protein